MTIENENEGAGVEAETSGAEASAGWTPDQQAKISAIVKARLAQDRKNRGAAPAAANTGGNERLDRVESALERLVTAMTPAAQPGGAASFDHGITAPVAAPAAPVKVDPLTAMGVVDLFGLSDAQLQQLGPSGLRREFEKVLRLSSELAGTPARPKPVSNGAGGFISPDRGRGSAR